MPSTSIPASRAVVPPLYELLEQLVRTHLRNAGDGTGELFGRAPRPLMVDANRMRGEILAVGRRGADVALVTLARTGFLRLYAARHVLEEVESYLTKWASETHTPEGDYRNAWFSVLGPLITEVSFSLDLLTPDELARVRLLGQPRPLGDPDDVPSVVAAMVLGAPLLTGDVKPLVAVYGADVDVAQHDAYLNALFGGGRMLVVSQWGHLTLVLIRLLGELGAAGVRAVSARTGTPPLAVGAVAVAGAAGLAGVAAHRQRHRRRTGPAEQIRVAMSAIAEIYAYYRQAGVDYNRLNPPAPPDLEKLPHDVAAARASARRTALDKPSPIPLDVASEAAWRKPQDDVPLKDFGADDSY